MSQRQWLLRTTMLISSTLVATVMCSPVLAEVAGSHVTTTKLDIVDGPVETRSTPFLAWYQDLSEVGYVEEEYLVAGKANIYEYIDDVAQRPEVRVATPDVPYTTRILVRKPRNPSRFNGTVLVDVLNATAGWDGDAVWYGNFEYIIRTGAVWVGVSTKPVTVDFLRDGWGRPPWPPRNASRYASLSMPEFGQVWDMLTQIGALLKSDRNRYNPLQHYGVERLIMVGYSQSAAYQVTYANSVHEMARLRNGQPVYDGYLIEAGGARAKHVTGPPTAIENLPQGDLRNLVQVDVPAIKVQTQTEVVLFPSYPTRQSEAQYPWVRTYEIAGGSHVDLWRDVQGGQALVRDLGLPPSFCAEPDNPKNPLRTAFYESAALHNLIRWIEIGRQPPPSKFLELTMTSTGAFELVLDEDGNAVGGIRPPELQAPIGTYFESNTGPGFCFLYGGFSPFTEERLHELYPNRGAYVRQFVRGVRDAVRHRYLLPADAVTLLRESLKPSAASN